MLRGAGRASPDWAALSLSSQRTGRGAAEGSLPTLQHPHQLRTPSRRARWEHKPPEPYGISKTELGGPGVATSKACTDRIVSP